MEQTESGKIEVGVAEALKELWSVVGQIEKIIFGERPKESTERVPPSDVVVDLRNQINDIAVVLRAIEDKLKLLR